MRLQLSKLHAEEFQGMQESEETLMALSRALIELSRQAEVHTVYSGSPLDPLMSPSRCLSTLKSSLALVVAP